MQSTIRAFLLSCASLSFAALSLVSGTAAQDESFTGTWRIVSASPAPWADSDLASTAEAQAFIGQEIVFQPDRVEAPAPLGCANATYGSVGLPPEGLFQGSLDPASAEADAASLGIEGEAETLQVTCDTGVFDYHSAGDDLLTALDNVIYTLERQEQP